MPHDDVDTQMRQRLVDVTLRAIAMAVYTACYSCIYLPMPVVAGALVG